MKQLSVFLSALLVICPAFQQVTLAQQTPMHTVSLQDLRQEIVARKEVRSHSIREVQTLLRHESVKRSLGGLFDLERIEKAVRALDGQTLIRLAQESRRINDQLRAGEVSKKTWIMIAALVVFVVVVLVVSLDFKI